MDQPQHGEGRPNRPGSGEPPRATPERNGRARLGTGEWLALALAVLVAHLFHWRLLEYPSEYDSQGYRNIADEFVREGLFTRYQWSEIRTYAYPLLLSVLVRAARALGAPAGWVVFEAQLALYLLAAAFLRRRLAVPWPAFAPWAFVAIVLNPFALSYVPESLTESVTLSLILLAAGCWLALFAGRGPAWSWVLAGSLILGTAVMVRPANLFALAAWGVALAALFVARRPPARAWLPCALALVVGCVLPIVPQYANNVRNYGRHTPLVVASLGTKQQYWGIANIKYATVVFPAPARSALVERPRVFYVNPLAAGTAADEHSPLSWYLEYPGAGALTLALHVFNMLDQDLLFTYSRDLDPWYRIPVGVVNHALVALALIGAGVLAARARRDPGLALGAAGLAAYALAHVGLHATTLVEMRFGLPLLLLASPLASAAVRALLARPAWYPRLLAAAFVVAWIAGSLSLSHWVRQQAPLIREWQKGPTAFAEKKREVGVPPPRAPARTGIPEPGRAQQKKPKDTR
jgi:hypothetical protein